MEKNDPLGLDPLSTRSGSNPGKKTRANNLEEQLQQQEQKLLQQAGGGFVIKKAADYNPQLRPNSGLNQTSTTTLISESNANPMSTSMQKGTNPLSEEQQTHSTSLNRGFPSQNPTNMSVSTPVLFPKEKVESTSIPTFQNTQNFHNTQSEEVDSPVSKSNSGSNSMSIEDSLPGEVLRLKTFGTIFPHQFPKLVADGAFFVTNFKFIFKPHNPNFLNENKIQSDYLQVPLGLFLSAEKKSDKQNPAVSFIDIYCKDGRSFKIKFQMREVDRIIHVLHTYSTIERKEEYFAYEYFKYERGIEDKYKGWKLFDAFKEFKRQGIDAEPPKDGSTSSDSVSTRFKYVDNRGGKICSTYPPYFIIPAKIKDYVLKGCAAFRSRERLPILSYYYKETGACMYRSAQSKPGIYSNRSPEDETYLQFLGNPDMNENFASSEINLQIYDARPYLAAFANKANGKGFEDIKNYRNCEISFMQIENIHHVRDSLKKMHTLSYSTEAINRKWYSQLESAGWLDMISYILAAGLACAQNLITGKNCLVHCSDGWDRTAQISGIAQILLDPYFRTIEGFAVLIDKEYLSYGFQAALRHGLGLSKEKDDQKAPVLLQFLDAVHQLIHQFPFAFEYNTKFLKDIYYHAYSCQFGNFLNNSALQMEQSEVKQKTVSLWSYILSRREEYLNEYYEILDSSKIKLLKPNPALKFMRVWEENYLYYSTLAHPPFEIEPDLKFFCNFQQHMFNKERQRNQELERKILALEEELKKAKGADTDGLQTQQNGHHVEAQEESKTNEINSYHNEQVLHQEKFPEELENHNGDTALESNEEQTNAYEEKI